MKQETDWTLDSSFPVDRVWNLYGTVSVRCSNTAALSLGNVYGCRYGCGKYVCVSKRIRKRSRIHYS